MEVCHSPSFTDVSQILPALPSDDYLLAALDLTIVPPPLSTTVVEQQSVILNSVRKKPRDEFQWKLRGRSRR